MKYIKGFDSLRAISVIFVLLAHLGLFALLPENEFVTGRVWHLMSGGTGVQIFFTLSGFLITKILLLEAKNYGSINFRNFYLKRFLRLSPPLLVFFILLAILVNLEYIETSIYGFLYSFFYIYNFIPNAYYTSELGHTWSLGLEEQYYLIWPLIIHFIRRKSIYIIIFITLLICIVAIYAYPHFPFYENFVPRRWFIPAVAPVLIGSLFALMLSNAENKWNSLFNKGKTALIAGLLLFISPLYFPFIELSFILQSIGISLVLIWISFNQESQFTSVLHNKPMVYIGRMSYGLYVYQGLFLTTGPSGELWIQQFPQNIILTLATAILSFHFIEKPILRLKSKFRRPVLKGV